MALWDDVVNEVYSLTNRQDLVAETALAVRQETQAAHRSDFYKRDLQEIQVLLIPLTVHQIPIDVYFPNFRAFNYIRPYTIATVSFSPIVIGRNQFLAPDAILDEYLAEKVNVAYVAGNNLNIRLEAAYDGFVVGYYMNPVVFPSDSYASWIAEEYSSLIVIGAAMRVFMSIGYEEAAARLKTLLYGPNGDAKNITGGEYALLRDANIENVAG